jgi:hypothetical protein
LTKDKICQVLHMGCDLPTQKLKENTYHIDPRWA